MLPPSFGPLSRLNVGGAQRTHQRLQLLHQRVHQREVSA